MLIQLTIRHYVIIDNLELTFTNGMSTITGETGAGKSIIIDALDLVLGKRADNRCVAVDKPQCQISALFNIQHIQPAKTWLNEHGLTDPDDDNQCVLRRCIYRDNPSRAYINGHMVTLAQLRTLGSLLVHIHGQHEHQQLLKPTQQCHLLDRFGQHHDLCAKVKSDYQAWSVAREQLDSLLAKIGENTDDKKAYLQYQIDELHALDIKADDVEQLEKTIKQVAQYADVNHAVQHALLQLADNEQHAILTELANTQQQLHDYTSLYSELQSIHQLLEQAHIHAQEAYSSLQDFAQHNVHNPEQQQHIETRLSTIYELARKHRVQANQLHTVLPQLEDELADLANIDDTIAELTQQIDTLVIQYQETAAVLSNARQTAATQLNAAITDYMQQLGMQGGQFSVYLQPHHTPHITGLEHCEFTVSANPGQPLQPLAKVASGGELSRISLAIQLITAQTRQCSNTVI